MALVPPRISPVWLGDAFLWCTLTAAMSEPLISVVMPLRNAATTLAETLDSIQSQTLHNIEVIMVDDFSEDDTRLIAEALCNSDQRFRCIKATNRGLVPALNQGIQEARSPS